MTREYLEAHFRLKEMLNRAKARYEALLVQAQPGAQNLDGMPRTATVGRKVEDVSLTLAEVSKSVDELTREVERSQVAVVEWIRSLPDPELQAVLGLRYLEAMRWREVAASLHLTKGQVLDRFDKARATLDEKIVPVPTSSDFDQT